MARGSFGAVRLAAARPKCANPSDGIPNSSWSSTNNV